MSPFYRLVRSILGNPPATEVPRTLPGQAQSLPPIPNVITVRERPTIWNIGDPSVYRRFELTPTDHHRPLTDRSCNGLPKLGDEYPGKLGRMRPDMCLIVIHVQVDDNSEPGKTIVIVEYEWQPNNHAK